jgi:hypothetical protein
VETSIFTLHLKVNDWFVSFDSSNHGQIEDLILDNVTTDWPFYDGQ